MLFKTGQTCRAVLLNTCEIPEHRGDNVNQRTIQ